MLFVVIKTKYCLREGWGGLAMALDENKRYPASLIVLLDLVISCPGMLEFDPRGLGTLHHIFCDHCNHPSPEDSWDRRKGCFTTWLTGAHTQPPKLVWPPLTSATWPMPWILTVSTTEGIFQASKHFLSTCYWCLCSQILGIFTEVCFYFTVSSSQFWEYSDCSSC